MKPELYEISDDEWENHSFKPSRILKRPRSSSPPPPIESFAYNPQASSDDDDDCVEITRESATFPESLHELDDADGGAQPPASRGRRFIIDDDDDEDEEDGGDVELCEVEEEDVVGRALQKCARISAELKGELFGSTGTACERYSEVESSSVRIVTQV